MSEPNFEPPIPGLEEVQGEVITPEDLGSWSYNFTRPCLTEGCRQLVTVADGKVLPHACELEVETWYHGGTRGKALTRARITRAWLLSVVEQLHLDPETVYEINLGAKSVLVKHYQNDEKGRRQLAPNGTGVLTYTEEYVVVG